MGRDGGGAQASFGELVYCLSPDLAWGLGYS
jgi:hypothetical protein